jgi:uncharacterized protein YndB with AHSA1/START domain
MKQLIHHKIFYSHAPEVVWDYLTKAELMEQWLMKNDFKPIVGHLFQFTIGPMPKLEFDGIIYCKVLEVVPFKKLSYSWQSGSGDGKFNVDSVVHWSLTAKDNGTELDLLHDGFEGTTNSPIFDAMNDGWLQNMKKISERIKTATHGATSK